LPRSLSRHICGSGGVLASLFSHNIGCRRCCATASEALQQMVIPAGAAGEQIAALAITEPGGGSDVASLRTTARREGRMGHQRREGLHHLGHARRLDHGGGAHR
jgi:acyl-CoA dehydrogenase